jgi:hypothetical protein
VLRKPLLSSLVALKIITQITEGIVSLNIFADVLAKKITVGCIH